MRFKGKRAVVTGAASGLGLATAQRLRAEGADVLSVDRNADLADAMATPRLLIDIASKEAPEAIVRTAMDKLGGIDFLVNNAGLGRLITLEESDDDYIDDTMAINLRATIRLTREALRVISRPGGSIVNIASIFGEVGFPRSVIYGHDQGRDRAVHPQRCGGRHPAWHPRQCDRAGAHRNAEQSRIRPERPLVQAQHDRHHPGPPQRPAAGNRFGRRLSLLGRCVLCQRPGAGRRRRLARHARGLRMSGERGELEGRVAIVTGAAGGMGDAITQAFLAAGCRVVATDLKPQQLPEAGDALSRLSHDASSESDWHIVVAEAVGRFGRIDILVNNAAYFEPASFVDTSAADMDAHYRVNQRGVLIGMQAVLPAMRSAGRGTIVNICSVAALSGSTGAFAYMSTKWAIRGMSRAAARELAPLGIRVNAIMPGLIDTAMMACNPPERNAGIIGAIPAGRAGRSEEVAEAALYLASDRSAYLTGSEIVVDGGLSA